MREITFEVTEDQTDGVYSASPVGYGIHTQGDSLDGIRGNVREAVECYFHESMPRPRLFRLHFVRDELLVALNCPVTRAGRASVAEAIGLRAGTPARLPRAAHDSAQWLTSRGHSASQYDPGKSLARYPEKHRPSPRDERRPAGTGTRSVVQPRTSWRTASMSGAYRPRGQVPRMKCATLSVNDG